MRLIRYNKNVQTFDPNLVYPRSDRDAYFKPCGLWVSDEDDYGWSKWCTSEEFQPDGLKYAHLVELYPDNNVLFLRSVEELDYFHKQFATHIGDFEKKYRRKPTWLNWTNVYPLWQGIIITPYLWERRMDYMWYYGWDCASGCIWDLHAIRTFQPLFKQLTWEGGQ